MSFNFEVWPLSRPTPVASQGQLRHTDCSTAAGMRPQKRLIFCAAILLAGLRSAFGLPGSGPILTNAAWSGNQFQFTLQGETNVSYIVESSTDLRTWTAAITNSDSQATRTINASAPGSHGFWRVRSLPGLLFEYAILASGNVNLAGSGRVDSFNSTNALESTLGQYDPVKATDRALVGTTSRTPGAVAVGNMQIYGSVATGPGGTVTLGPNGGVGTTAFNNNPANRGKIEAGHYFNDANYFIPPATLPNDFGPILPLVGGLYPPVGGTNYKYAVVSEGDYRVSSISLGAGEKMLVNAKARLHVLGNTTVLASGYILLGPDASLEWHSGGQVSLGGGGCINESRLAQNFLIVGLSTNTISYSGSSRLIGTIYAPSAAVTLTGTSDAVGAVVCNTFTLSGSMGLHCDESLKSVGPSR